MQIIPQTITTNYLDPHNDYIEFYVITNPNGNFILTDDGYTLIDMRQSGFLVKKEKVELIVQKYGLIIANDSELTAVANEENLEEMKALFAEALHEISKIYV